MSQHEWLLLTYRIPPEPARRRVAVWRRLKGMGALYLQGGVCLLPRTDDHLRRLKVLENEIAEAGGEALLLGTAGLDRKQTERVVARFNADRDEDYKELIEKCIAFEAEVAEEIHVKHFTYAELEENEQEYKKFKRWIEKIQNLDFYNAPRGQEARDRLSRSAIVLDTYAHHVFAAQDENRMSDTPGT